MSEPERVLMGEGRAEQDAAQQDAQGPDLFGAGAER
jgi:hypothetical protein